MAVNKIRESTQAGGDYCWTTLSAGRLGWFVQAGRRQQAEAGRINLPLLPILAPHSTAGSERVWPSCLEVGGQVRCYRRYLSLSLSVSLFVTWWRRSVRGKAAGVIVSVLACLRIGAWEVGTGSGQVRWVLGLGRLAGLDFRVI